MKNNLFFLCICIAFFSFNSFQYAAEKEAVVTTVPVGAVIDLNSPLGSTVHSCIELAVSDFYSQNPNYTTRLKIHTKDAQTLLETNLAVMELLEQEQVRGVIGPQESTASESLFAEIGNKYRVPIISFSSRNSPISYTNNPYFVRTTPDNAIQARALASLCQEFEWYEVAVLYEDTDHGYHFPSHLNKALQEIEVRLAYMVSFSNTDNDSSISRELNKLPTKQTRVFIVHMSLSLGSRFFRLAKSLGVMSEGYAWIITDILSNFMNGIDSITRESMEGVLGIRPCISTSSQEFKSFQERWRKNMIMKNNLSSSSSSVIMELNVYGLWAYDAVTALAIAIEKTVTNQNTTSISNLGHTLLDEVSRMRFEGLSGEFQITNGNMKLSAFEIFNIYGSGEKTIGFWKPERGRTLRDLRSKEQRLGKVIWPGESMTRPKSASVPTSRVLRVGVPLKRGYTEFVNVTVDPVMQRIHATGFSIDIFLSALDLMNLPIKHEFHYYIDTQNSTPSYDNMLSRIPMDYDMAVGDITISAPRAEYLDFSQPFSESGLTLVVKNNNPKGMWIFHKPLRWDLWLAIFVSFVSMGIVLLVLERRSRRNEEGSMDQTRRMTYFTPVAVLAFPETNLVRNKWSLLVLVFWLFTAFILMQSYTANLAAMLTVDQLNFAFSDYYNIGYQGGSFMEKFLTENLHISKSRLKSYTSAQQYHEAMSLGSKNGGIDAIFDEVPYMKILLKTYRPKYKMVGPTYRTGGFGFAFQKNYSLVSYFSKAILDVTQGPNMTYLERKHFGPGYSSLDPLSSTITRETSSLRLYDFAGLFLIVGSVTVFALFFSETSIGKNIMDKTVNFINSYVLIRLTADRDSRVHATSDQTNDGTDDNNSAQENYDGSDGNNGEGFEFVEDREDNVHETSDADTAHGFRQ